ncbi:DUF2066 domain-containing protein [Pseudoxanthomonas dokdonensis]|uniref:DUF2066 domain-containing protein n=1 Tax=Pseudoxanthomonas dokdonensis TaxID=344882 RepID=A0A0R0CE50_9GAMM|nr:hypothetical protein ABB29_14475 [Pseudoxanthomonas dokdonensis]
MRRISGFSFAAVMLLLTAFFLPGMAWAQSSARTEGDAAAAQGVYEAEVPVNGQAESDRNSGFARAMGIVLGKVSGDRAAATKPQVRSELRNAANYVESYDFRQDEGTSASGAPTFRTTLVVRFDPARIDAIAGALGLAVWPQPRPKPVMWLAINDGSGPRLVGLQQANAARPVLDRAIQRGYRLGLPTGSASEQALAGAIWRQDTAAVARASARYSPPMQLVGKLYRADGGWQADWVFVDGGKVLSRWSSSNADPRQAMASGADGAADALMKRYAKAGTVGTPGVYRVVFNGINSTADYIRLMSALQSNVVVRNITPVSANGSTLELDLDLVSGLPGFKQMLGNDSILVGGEGEPPVFFLQ